jgi:hypothetical protein
VRHGRRCEARTGGACSCIPSFQAQAWSAKDRKPLRKTFKTLGEARRWRQEAQVALRRGRLNTPSRRTVGEAGEEWLVAARRGIVRTRSGDPYKPSAIRAYGCALRSFIGPRRLSQLTRNDVQDLVDRLVAEGRAPSTVGNAVLPLRAIYRRASAREEVATNPTLGLALATRPSSPRAGLAAAGT